MKISKKILYDIAFCEENARKPKEEFLFCEVQKLIMVAEEEKEIVKKKLSDFLLKCKKRLKSCYNNHNFFKTKFESWLNEEIVLTSEKTKTSGRPEIDFGSVSDRTKR